MNVSKISASILAADIFNLESWIKKMIQQGIKIFHIDLIDPSFASYIGTDFKIIEKIAEIPGIIFDIHYMAKWNDELIHKIFEHKPRKIFFHTKKIENYDLFHKIKAGIAIELQEDDFLKSDNVNDYIIMSVPIGFSGQSYNNANEQIALELKNQKKHITADGGINPFNIKNIKFFDEFVVGNSLNKHSISEFL